MLADIKRELCEALGILDPQEGVAQRATLWWTAQHHPFRLRQRPVGGTQSQEVLRVLDALQTDELCPCNWQKGESVLKPAI